MHTLDKSLVWVCVKRLEGCSMMLSLTEGGNLVRWNSSFHMGEVYKVTPRSKRAR